MLPDTVLDHFYDSTPFGGPMIAERVYRKCPISLSHRVTLVNLVELDILDFDFILRFIGWTLVMLLLIVEQFPNEPLLSGRGEFYAERLVYFIP